MFSLREFVLKGIKDAIGKMADYQIILNSMGWYEKNVLTQEDLELINEIIDNKNKQEDIQNPETPIESETPIEPETLVAE